MLRKLMLGAILLAGSAAPALAASPGGFNWTGFYAGVNGGYGGDRFDYPSSASITSGATTDSFSGHLRLNSSGFLGGGQVGYNVLTPNHLLLGAEADIDATNIKGQINGGASLTGADTGDAAFTVGSKINYLGTARARIGYAADRIVVYGTGGLAFGQVESTASANLDLDSQNIFSGAVSHTDNRTGWTAGAGVEYAVSDKLTLKTEYLYADLGRHAVLNQDFTLGADTGSAVINVKTTANIVRMGLNYKF